MSNRIEVLTQRLIGYNKKQVDEYLEEISITHQKMVNFLKDNIENYQQEKERLKAELIALKTEKQEINQSKGFLELALRRTAGTIPLINKLAEEDIEKILKDSKDKVFLYEKKVADIEKEMDIQRTEIDLLLNSLLQVFKKQKTVKLFNKTEKTEKNPAEKMDSIMYPLSEKKMTADGYALSGLNVLTDTSQCQRVSDEKKGSSAGETFWEEGGALSPKPGVKSTIKLTNMGKLPDEFFSYSKLSEKYLAELEEKPLDQYSLSSVNHHLAGSPTVGQEIDVIRQKYIVGKKAGADLLDPQGNLIISKNSIITWEVVKNAEKEGKLAELILNMSLAGIEEE